MENNNEKIESEEENNINIIKLIFIYIILSLLVIFSSIYTMHYFLSNDIKKSNLIKKYSNKEKRKIMSESIKKSFNK